MANFNIKEIYVRYSEWVSRNPQTTSGIESAIKYISFFLAGRSKSGVISELVYSTSNLIVLFNDNIIRKCQPLHNNGLVDKLKMWLTVLEYSEVFLEVSAARTWGARGKWIVITLIQIFKYKIGQANRSESFLEYLPWYRDVATWVGPVKCEVAGWNARPVHAVRYSRLKLSILEEVD